MSDEMREAAEKRVLAARGSYDAPGFEACVDAELAKTPDYAHSIIAAKLNLAKKSPVILSWDDAYAIKAALASKPQVTEDEAVEIMAPAIMNTPSHPKITDEVLARYEARAAFRALLQHSEIRRK